MHIDPRPYEANYCTVELRTGAFVRVAATPREVLRRVAEIKEDVRAGDSDGMVALPLMTTSGKMDGNFRQVFWVYHFHIGTIYPLDEHPSQLREATRAQPSEVT